MHQALVPSLKYLGSYHHVEMASIISVYFGHQQPLFARNIKEENALLVA